MSPKPARKQPPAQASGAGKGGRIETLEQALEILRNAEPQLGQLKAKKDQELLRAAAEIDMLQRRVHEQADYLPLPGGATIAIRSCYTQAEEDRARDLLVKTGSGDVRARNEFLELVTQNPLITADYIEANPDKVAVQDLLDVMLGWLEDRKRKREDLARRLKDLRTFRAL